MANEIRLSYLSGYTTYAIVRNGSGQVWNTSGTPAFEAWVDGNIADYDIALTDKSGDMYLGDFPTSTAGTYFIQYYIRAGAAPAITDSMIDTAPFVWDGTSEVTVGSFWGAGANTVTLTIRDTDGGTLSGVEVWVYTSNDSSGSITAPRLTGASGTVQFSLDDGVFYAFCYKQGYTFIVSGTTNRFTVSGTTAATLDMGQAVSTGTASYYSDSFLTRALADARELVDEPGINAKYSDARLIRRIEDAYGLVAGDVCRSSVTPVVALYTITYVAGTNVYRLPPTIQSVIAIYQTGTGGYRLFWDSRSHYNTAGRGVWMEGRAIHIQESWFEDGAELVVEYIAQCPRLMNGTCTVDSTGLVVTLGAAYQGTKDTRDNAYAGCIFRIIRDSDADYDYVQERTVVSHSCSASTATLDVALSPNNTDSTGTTYFEIVPPIPILMDRIVPTLTAMQIAAAEGAVMKSSLLKKLYEDLLRSVQLQEFYSNLQQCARIPQDNYRNSRYRGR